MAAVHALDAATDHVRYEAATALLAAFRTIDWHHAERRYGGTLLGVFGVRG
jgi:hypothetical protein